MSAKAYRSPSRDSTPGDWELPPSRPASQGALDDAIAYARERETFGKLIIEHQGLASLLADVEAAVESARA